MKTKDGTEITVGLKLRHTRKGLRYIEEEVLAPNTPEMKFERDNNYWEVNDVNEFNFSLIRVMPEGYDHRIVDYLECCEVSLLDDEYMEFVPEDYKHTFPDNIVIAKEPNVRRFKIEHNSLKTGVAKIVIEQLEEYEANNQQRLSHPELEWFIGYTLANLSRSVTGKYIQTEMEDAVRKHRKAVSSTSSYS